MSEAIKNNINKVIIGKSEVVELLITALISNGHILLEDVPGTVRQCWRSLWQNQLM